jgi:hypothetical protein
MDDHDCVPPLDDRPIDDPDWECPDCHARWHLVSTDPYDPTGNVAISEDDEPEHSWKRTARWERLDG